MATKRAAMDQFANIAYLTVTEAVAGTLKFARLEMANNLLTEKAALIIHRAEIFLDGPSLMNGTGDYAIMGITLSDRITDLSDLSQPEILISMTLARADFGAAASGFLEQKPYLREFSELPGGGILVPADRLYIGIKGSGLTAVAAASCRIYYTVKPLDTADYWELIEARRVMST